MIYIEGARDRDERRSRRIEEDEEGKEKQEKNKESKPMETNPRKDFILFLCLRYSIRWQIEMRWCIDLLG